MRQLIFPLLAGFSLAACISPQGWSEAPLDDRYYASSAPVSWWGSNAVSVDAFYAPLSRHGRWDLHPRYGRVFVPAVSASSWQPYSRGYWREDPRHGRLWVSAEPFGWATYHYGRWGREPGIGWYWVPDIRFGPAWVDWRYAGGAAGWAPLPPYGWDRYGAGQDWWLWAPGNRLWSPGLDRYARPGRPPHDRDHHDGRRPDRDRPPTDVASPVQPRPTQGGGTRPGSAPREGWQGQRPLVSPVEAGRHPRSTPTAGLVREANAAPRAEAPPRPMPPPQARPAPPPRPVAAPARPAPSRSPEPAAREDDR
jgi:hypothetical protein